MKIIARVDIAGPAVFRSAFWTQTSPVFDFVKAQSKMRGGKPGKPEYADTA